MRGLKSFRGRGGRSRRRAGQESPDIRSEAHWREQRRGGEGRGRKDDEVEKEEEEEEEEEEEKEEREREEQNRTTRP